MPGGDCVRRYGSETVRKVPEGHSPGFEERVWHREKRERAPAVLQTHRAQLIGSSDSASFFFVLLLSLFRLLEAYHAILPSLMMRPRHCWRWSFPIP